MEHQSVKNRLLDLVDNTLSPELKEEITRHLEQCEECRDVYKQYRSIIGLEQAAAAKIPCLTDDLSAAVMAKVNRIESNEVIPRELRVKARWIVGSLLSMNAVMVVILALLVRSTYFPPARAAINVSSIAPLVETQGYAPVTFRRSVPLAPLGYQSLSLNLESTNGIEQLARPDALVDIKCAYEEGGEKRQAVVSQLVRILSASLVNGQAPQETKASGQTVTVTLLVPEGDAKRIELARLLGELSLSVITPKENEQLAERQRIVTLYDPSGRPVTSEASPNTVAVMYEADPKTGSQKRRVFVDGQWRDEKGLELVAF